MKKSSFSLLAILFLTLAGTSVAASTPADAAVEPTAAPAAADLELGLDVASDQICTESMTGEAVPTEGGTGPVDVLTTETGWWYGICVPNFCQQCSSNYDCTGGNTCQYDVQCP